MHNPKPPGAGTIAKVIFSVNQDAQLGAVDTIKLEDDNDLHYDNALSDIFGTLIFPILVDGIFTVGTTNVGSSKDLFGSQELQYFALDQNYPNPFNFETSIKYQIPYTAEVVFTIYNFIIYF